MRKLKAEITQLDARIDAQRAALSAQGVAAQALLRRRITAPRTVLAVVVGGVALGWLCRGSRRSTARGTGLPLKQWLPWVVRLAPLVVAAVAKVSRDRDSAGL